MQFGLPSPVIGLNKEATTFALRDDASETNLETGTTSKDDYSTNFPYHSQTVVRAALRCSHRSRAKLDVLHSPKVTLSNASIMDRPDYLSIRRLVSLSK